MSEHDFEPIRGLPGPLPEGETILWQGAPDWRVLAVQAFHVRAVAIYFGGHARVACIPRHPGRGDAVASSRGRAGGGRPSPSRALESWCSWHG